jgi:CheY-like chemotaxis protein
MARDLDGTILIVDDDSGVREALRDTLEDAGYRVGEATDGEEALAWLRSHPPPALIFLDWNMVPMNAPQFIDEFRKERSFSLVPVVLMTADMHAPEKVTSGPYHGYITKPVNLDTLFDVIGRVAG